MVKINHEISSIVKEGGGVTWRRWHDLEALA
jgi:hypothetical protein